MSLAMGLLFGGFAGYGAMQTSTNPRNVMVSLGELIFNEQSILPCQSSKATELYI